MESSDILISKSKFFLMVSAVSTLAFSFNRRMVDNDNDVSCKFLTSAVIVAAQKTKILAGVNFRITTFRRGRLVASD